MKKSLLSLGILILLSVALPAQKFAISFSGGMGYFTGGDLTAGLKGENAYRSDVFNVANGYTIQKTGLNFSGEIIFFPWRNFGIGVGAEYQKYVKQSQIGFKIGSVDATETIKPEVNATPVTLNLHYLIPLSSKLKIGVSAGAGYYRTTLKYNYASEFGIGTQRGTETYAFEARKGAIGYQGSLGFEFAVSRHLSIVLNATGRYARISPFEKGIWSSSRGGSFGAVSKSGSNDSFWIYDWLQDGKTYGQLAFQESAPAGLQGMSNVRKARLDLTGASVTLGFKIGFGRI